MVRAGNQGRSRTAARSAGVVAMTLGVTLLLTSCNPATMGTTAPADIDVLDKVRSLDIMPRRTELVNSVQSNAGERGRAAVFEGTEISDIPEVRMQRTAASGNGYDLNFENTPIATVAKVVLGDILGTGYTIDPRVQGTVSLVSVRPVPKSDIVFVLENALRLSGVVLVRDSAGYRLTPLGDAVGSGRVDQAAANPEPGYGVSVVPLQYVSAATVLKLLDSFATKPGSVRADPTRNLLLIQGTGAERQTAVETAMSFDVDWMRGQSVGIYPVGNSAPEPIIAELEKIMDSGESGLSQNVVKFQPVSRLNAILVVSRKPALLHTAASWIRRLDHADTARNSVHVYRVKYGDAKQIARVLTDMFIGGSQGSLDSPDNQLAPGSGLSATSSADRLSLGANNASSATSGFASRMSTGGNGGNGATTPGFGQPLQAGSANSSSGTSALDSRSSGSGGQPLMQNVRITPDAVNNSLLIYADQGNYRIIEATLMQVDQPPLQVAIDATIAEVTLTNELSYGVQFFLTSHNLGLRPNQGSVLNTQSTQAPGSTTTSTTPTTGTDATSAAAAAGSVAGAFINRAFPGFNFLIGSEAQPSAILDALHTVTSVKVLSNPSLVVINNQAATLQVGDVVPVSTGSATVLTTSNTVVNTIDYRNTGIILRVSPRINVNGNVRLEVEQEISNVSPTTAASLTPTVSERRVKSSISVASGQTVLLAGLISEQQNGNRNGIPLLDEIQGLGDAFSHQDKKGTRTELIIFIRPQIIRDGTDAHHIAEELRSKLRGSVGASTDDLRVRTVR
ncbi:type II secretion system secretin GspD [Bradyrhizobium sp. NP1]|uniref:type II secretion system secretin GspD n=1 Tax=Bradyrhizobium sp. NP1 TaxID=3049772 RepID=UPI0025A5B422|nr:type II secretion system secretin GspD [Bradyrhizobium sp. NP1]WJR79984.1 type II secretion system secretin GspD [Bradyrhizobium sp. NP1]